MWMTDLAPLSRSTTIGFDRVFDMLDQVMHMEANDEFPPCDIERIGEDAYRVTLAVPGFALGDVTVESHPNLLVVTGCRSRDQGGQYLHRGLGPRSFERRFGLVDFVEVTAAGLSDGLLTIELRRKVPEAMRPRRIEIANGAGTQATEDRRAA